MTRLWNLSQRAQQNGAGTAAPPPPPPLPGPPPELIDPNLDEPAPYESRPVRPLAQLAARVGLWAAVAFGCIGGLVGMFRPAGGNEQVVADSEIEAEVVPAPVSGVAEQAVEAWLLMSDTDEDQRRLAELFVEPPDTSGVFTDTLTLMDVTTVTGERLNDGYWTVTVAADVVETMPIEPDDEATEGSEDDTGEEGTDDEGSDEPETSITTWYAEVGIVGEVGKGLRALSTPGVVPAPAGVTSAWRPIYENPYRPDEDDDLASTIQGFLNALLAGNGDPSRYLAPHVEMRAADPAPFAGVSVDLMAAQETDEGDVRVWVQASARTAGEVVQVLAYEVVVNERVDRWEIKEIWGAPTVERAPEDEGSETPPPTGSGSTEGDSESEDEGGVDGTTEDPSGTDDGSTDGGSTEGDGTDEGTTDDTSADAGTEETTTSVEEDPLSTAPPGE